MTPNAQKQLESILEGVGNETMKDVLRNVYEMAYDQGLSAGVAQAIKLSTDILNVVKL